jgi:membrane-associated phospholipid phosphatase
VLRTQERSLADAAVTYAQLGIAVCDSFIACWRAKYSHNLLRPITYIRATIDPAWGDPLPLVTPPFPEYPSGHSVQSAAAAEVLTAFFGAIPFTDHTHDARGLPARSFASFDAFAEEAAISRLYGGIHFRSAIEDGLEQGRCIGVKAARLALAR